jgi:hypothetical protein
MPPHRGGSNASGCCGPSSDDEEERSQLVWSEAARKCKQKGILPLTKYATKARDGLMLPTSRIQRF